MGDEAEDRYYLNIDYTQSKHSDTQSHCSVYCECIHNIKVLIRVCGAVIGRQVRCDFILAAQSIAVKNIFSWLFLGFEPS